MKPAERTSEPSSFDVGSATGTQPPLQPAGLVPKSALEMKNDELRQTQAELDRLRARHFEFYDLAPTGYCTINTAGLILHANLATAKLLGVPRSSLTRQPFSEFIHPDSSHRFLRLSKQIIPDKAPAPSRHLIPSQLISDPAQAAGIAGEPRSCDLQLARTGGTQIWAQLTAVATPGADGSLEIRMILTDITARKQAEAASRVSDLALKSISQGVIITGPDRRIVSANEAFLSITGYTVSEILGRNCKLLQGPCSDPKTIEEIRSAVHSETAFKGEVLNYRKDGTPFWNDLTISPVRDPNGKLTHFIGITRDITPRKQAEAARRESESALLEAQRVAQLGNWSWDITNNTVHWSSEMFRLYERDQAAGQLSYEEQLKFYTQESATRLHAAVQKAVECGTDYELDLERVSKDGNRRWIAARGEALRDASGRIVQLRGTAQDITRRKAADEALARSTKLLEVTGALAKVGGWEVNLDTMKLSWTLETFRIAELEPPIEPPLEQGINLFAPEARPTIAAAVQAAIDSGKSYDLELPIITAKGNRRWVQTQGYAEMRNGKTVMIYGTFQDITARKKVETELRQNTTRLQTYFEFSSSGIWDEDFSGVRAFFDQLRAMGVNDFRAHFSTYPADVATCAGLVKVRDINRQTVHIMGAASKAEILTQLPAYFTAESLEVFKEELITLAEGGTHFESEIPIRLPDGRNIVCEFQLTVIPGAEASLDQVLFVFNDITERKRTAETLQTSLHEKTALLKEVHHRVKNNLQVITSLIRLEGGRSENADTKAVLDDMKGRIRSMAILHESLYRTGVFAAVDLGNYVRQIATQSFRSLLTRSRAIRLTLDLAPLAVDMDHAAPCGLLVNELISNCLKHGFPGDRTGEVKVDLRPLPDSTQWLLRVSDDGVGLPADFATKRGTSLGLQLVSDLVTQIGGTLEIGPSPLAAFTITFTPSVTEDS